MIKQTLFKLMLPVLGFAMILAPATALAWDPFGSVDCSKGASSAVCTTHSTGNPLTGPNGVIIKATNFVALIAGIAAVIILIVAGLKYVTAGGDPKAVGEAKNTIIYAVVGLVVIVAARALITFVVSSI